MERVGTSEVYMSSKYNTREAGPYDIMTSGNVNISKCIIYIWKYDESPTASPTTTQPQRQPRIAPSTTTPFPVQTFKAPTTTPTPDTTLIQPRTTNHNHAQRPTQPQYQLQRAQLIDIISHICHIVRMGKLYLVEICT